MNVNSANNMFGVLIFVVISAAPIPHNNYCASYIKTTEHWRLLEMTLDHWIWVTNMSDMQAEHRTKKGPV